MKILTALLIVFAMSSLIGWSHPAEDASDALQKAKLEYETAEKRFLASVKLIPDASKRKEVIKTFEKRKELFGLIIPIESDLKIAASPAPDTSTSLSLMPYWTETRYLKLQSADLNELAEWIENNSK